MPIDISAVPDGTSKEIYQGVIRPGNGPSVWIDNDPEGSSVIAAVCEGDDSEGHVYRIAGDELPEGTDLAHLPEGLLSEGNLEATIRRGSESDEHRVHVARDSVHGADIILKHVAPQG